MAGLKDFVLKIYKKFIYIKLKAYKEVIMNKNSDYILTKIIDPLNHAKKAQVGVDLSIAKIEIIWKESGVVNFDRDSKIHGLAYEEERFSMVGGKKVYHLKPQCNYAITFEQGLKTLEPNEWAMIIQRSSLIRAGMHVVSSVFDPGYHVDNIGTTMWTSNLAVDMPVGTRVAQMLIFENEPVATDDLYNGQWQGTNDVSKTRKPRKTKATE